MASIAQASTLSVIQPIAPLQAPEVAKNDCFSQIYKYDWDINQAKAVLMEENTSNNPGVINDNPDTGDYSVGCWQVNIKDELAYGRPSEEWLKDPENNTKWAYDHYVSLGRTFCTTSGWYNSCIKAGLLAYN